MANTGSDWFVGNIAFFVKIGKNKVVCRLSFVIVIGGKEILLYLTGHREQSQDLLLWFSRMIIEIISSL